MKTLSMFIRTITVLVCIAPSLVVAATVDTNYTIGDGTTTWNTTTFAAGMSSLELYWPKPGSNYAGVRVYDLGDPMVGDFATWSYWANAPEDFIPNFVISLDTALENYDGRDYDTNVNIWPRNDDHGNEWLSFQSSSDLPYVVWQNGASSPVMKTMSWDEFQQPFTQWGKSFDFGDAVIKQIRVWNGGIGTNQTITAYVDDIVLNGEVVPIEVPEPATMSLLALGGLGALIRRRNRK